MSPDVAVIGSSKHDVAFVDWGSVPAPGDRKPGRVVFTKNPETGFAYIWSWEYSCWMQFAAVPMDMGSPMDLVERNQALARENADLRRQVEELTRGVTHWKVNHDNRVEAARMLIERLDMPLERVGAYRQHLAALSRAAFLQDQLDQERSKRIPLASLLGVTESLRRLAVSIWEKHFRQDAPDWQPCDDAEGIVSQISNMLTELTRKED